MRYAEIITEAKKPGRFPGLTPAFLRKLRQIRHECRVDNGGGGACHLVSEWLEHEYGWQRVAGCFASKDYKEPVIAGHYWNLLPDGSILDTTADQTGDGHDIRVIKPSEADYHRYRPEFYDDFDPNHPHYDSFLASDFPHLDRAKVHHGGDDFELAARLNRERGNGWARTDPEQYERYREMQRREYSAEVP